MKSGRAMTRELETPLKVYDNLNYHNKIAVLYN